jgi:serine/threonine-protein kinase
VASTGRAKLVDFGLATLADDAKHSEKGATSRSIDYAALERASNSRKDDPRSDIFFAGCILYQMLTGAFPLAETKSHSERMSVARFRDIPPVSQLDSTLSTPVVALVSRAMELDLTKRFAKPAEMLAELRNVQKRLESGDTEATAEGSQGKLEREGENHSVMVVESNIEMQDALRDSLKRRGYRVLVISDAQRALGRFEGSEKPAEVVIFCSTELGESALDAFNRFGEDAATSQIPAILFLAEQHKDLAQRAQLGPQRVLLPMPLKVRQLRSILLKLISLKDGTAVNAATGGAIGE